MSATAGSLVRRSPSSKRSQAGWNVCRCRVGLPDEHGRSVIVGLRACDVAEPRSTHAFGLSTHLKRLASGTVAVCSHSSRAISDSTRANDASSLFTSSRGCDRVR